MRKSSLTLLAVAIGLAASQASAADLPRKAPAYVPPAPPPLTWTGCYIGANVGGAWGRFRLEGPFGGSAEQSTNNASFVGGGQIGCDYQFSGGWVIGFRNMFDGTTNSRDRAFNVVDATGTLVATGAAELRMRWFDALTGRIGYSWQPNSLLYFQGGGVWSRVEANLVVTDTATGAVFAGSASTTKTGWTIGGGWEYQILAEAGRCLSKAITTTSAGVIELYLPPVATACVAGCAFHTKTTAATALVGVNYRFGGFGTGL